MTIWTSISGLGAPAEIIDQMQPKTPDFVLLMLPIAEREQAETVGSPAYLQLRHIFSREESRHAYKAG